MANRTVKDAHSVKGTNPQYLVEKITRTRIYECRYWKEECFALTAELVVDKAMELKFIGGVFGGNIKPTPFICLILKMLQIQPEKDIVVEFITQSDFKYVRALGALYMRLTGTSMDCYKYLEPLYLDYRKIRRQNRQGEYEVVHMDEFIDDLLREERSCDVILPRIQRRHVLEETNQLETRASALDDDLEDMETDEEEDMVEMKDVDQPPSPERKLGHREWERPRRSPSPTRLRRSRSRSPHRRPPPPRGERERGHDRDRNRDRDRERERPRDRDRERRRSHSRDRHRHRSRSKSREKDRHKANKPHRHQEDERKSRHKSKRGRKDEKSSFGGKLSRQQQEIQEANELRAKLGMAPLKP